MAMQAIIHCGPISRASIAKQTGLSKQTVSELVRILEEGGWVRETGRTSGHVGRTATTYELVPASAFMAAVDLGGTKLRVAIVDLAGSVIPARHMGGRFATVAVNEFLFKQPVKVGDLLSFYGTIVRIGNTSITVQVEVWAERQRPHYQCVKVTEATLTYVAIDEQGRPRPVPRPAPA